MITLSLCNMHPFKLADIFDISSQLGRYEDSRLAVERCVHELNAIDHHHYSNTDEWVVSGIIIKQTEDGFVRYVINDRINVFTLRVVVVLFLFSFSTYCTSIAASKGASKRIDSS